MTNDAVLIDTAGYYTVHGTSFDERTGVPLAADEQKRVTAATQSKDGTRSETDDAATASANAGVILAHADTQDRRQTIDRAEWLGFLGMLRKHRPRAPVNGALLTIDLAELIGADEPARIATAAALRGRLAELRAELGIRFPVYLMLTKVDRLTGFPEYFGALTSESRTQAWGFTLPYGKETVAREGLRARCHDELMQLAARLTAAIDTRLQDEYDTGKRRRLAALPEEFDALIRPLDDLVERLFLDSRYDDTQLHSTLRGVYFTSASQTGNEIAADRHTVAQRLAADPEA